MHRGRPSEAATGGAPAAARRSLGHVRRAAVAAALLALLPLTATALAAGGGSRPLLVSRASGAGGAAAPSAWNGSPDASARRIAFVAAPFGGRPGGIYVRDVATRTTRFLGEGDAPALAADGARLAYGSAGHIWIRDLRGGAGRLIDRRAARVVERRRQGSSGGASIAADGNRVAFASTLTDLLGPASLREDATVLHRGQVYVRDLRSRRTVLASRAAGTHGRIGDGESNEPVIAAGGRFLAFTSRADNLVPGGTAGQAVYVRDLRTERVRAVSPLAADISAAHPSISADGRVIAFEEGRTGHPETIVVRDSGDGSTVVASHLTASAIHLQPAAEPTLSPDGRFLAFRGGRSIGGLENLYLVDLRTKRTRMAARIGAQDNSRLAFSADGRFLTYDTYVQNVPGRESGEPVTESGGVWRLANPLVAFFANRPGPTPKLGVLA